MTTSRSDEQPTPTSPHTDISSSPKESGGDGGRLDYEESGGTAAAQTQATAPDSSTTLARSPFESQGLETSGAPSNELLRRFRRAQANAMFDTGALEIMERLAKVGHASLINLNKIANTPEEWAKFGLLMQAYFVEVIGSQARVTQEGRTALSSIEEYAKVISAEDNQS